MSANLFRLLRALVTLSLLGFLLKTLPLREVGEALTGFRILPGIAFLLVSAVMIGLSTWKWGFVLRRLGIHESWSRLYGIYLIAYFYTNLLPSTVGGDVYRVTVVGKGKKPQSFAAVFAERGSGLCLLVLLAALSPLFLPAVGRDPALVAMVALSVAGCLGMAGCLASSRLLSLCTFLLRTVSLRGLAAKIEGFVVALKTVGKDPYALLGIVVLTVVFYLVVIANVLTGFACLGRSVSLSGLMGSVFLVMLISTIPVSINGLGLTEGAYVYCLGLAGVDPATAAGVALLLRVKSILTGILGGLISLSGIIPEAKPALEAGGEPS